MAAELSEGEQRFQRLIRQEVDRRAAAVKEEHEATQAIAALCVDARAAGVPMARLAEWIQVYDPKKDQRRSLTRQAVDNMVASFEGRVRQPRRRRGASSNGAGKLNAEVFGV